MDVNRAEVAQFLMNVRAKSSVYSKQEFAQILTKLYYLVADIDDLSHIRHKRYKSRSESALQLSRMAELLCTSKEALDMHVEQKLLLSLIEVTIGSLEELTSKKLESVLDIFIEFYYKRAVNEDYGRLESDFILSKLEKCFDLKTIKRRV